MMVEQHPVVLGGTPGVNLIEVAAGLEGVHFESSVGDFGHALLSEMAGERLSPSSVHLGDRSGPAPSDGLDGRRPEAVEKIRASARSGPWGWIDPEGGFLLDFWRAAADLAGLGPARFLLFYSYPWAASERLQRAGIDRFLRHPEWAYQLWEQSAGSLLRLQAEAPQDVCVVHWEAAAAAPERLVERLERRWGLELSGLQIGDPRSVEGEDPWIDLVDMAYPEAIRRLRDLDAVAEVSATGRWSPRPFRASCGRPDREDARPALSVVMPCYDDGPFLIEAVASVERVVQAGTPVEVVVVNDGSSEEETCAILDRLRESGVYVIDQENKGLSAARNRGIAEARGRYILPLDADNRLVPEHPARALEVLEEQPRISVVYSYWWEFGGRNALREPPEFDLGHLLRANFIDACAVFRRIVWEEIGGYDEEMRFWEDWEFWIRAAACGHRFHLIREPGFEYRVRPGSLVELTQDRTRHEQATAYIARKHEALYQERLVWLASKQHGEITFLLQDLDRLRAELAQLEDRSRRDVADLQRHLAELEEGSRREINELLDIHRGLELDLGLPMAELRSKLPEIWGSVGWRLLVRWWALRSKVFPEGSWRYRVYLPLRRAVERWLER